MKKSNTPPRPGPATGQPIPVALADQPFAGILPRPLGRVRQQIADGLVAKGVDPVTAEHVVGQLGDGTLLKWLIEHGPDIAKLVMQILALLG